MDRQEQGCDWTVAATGTPMLFTKGHIHKATHMSKYLDFHSHGPVQSKRAVVKILLDRAKGILSTTARR